MDLSTPAPAPLAPAAPATAPTSLLALLRERGLVAQTTLDDAGLEALLSQSCTGYIGFDPTADSLHVGSLVPIMALHWLQVCGHRPLVVVGGATALIGDPSGKSSMRRMLSPSDIAANAEAIAGQIGRLVRFDDSPAGARLLNNADWLTGLSWIDLLREVGPCMSVNRMLSMDSVKMRIEEGGISFLEFNYMVMQAYDFVHLSRTQGCRLQLGGQDQWGNIVMGIDLARRLDGSELVGITLPLVTKKSGQKFGKSESGNIWLSAARTSVHDFYQFWRNTADEDLERFLRFFTTLPIAEIAALLPPDAPQERINAAKEALAHHITARVHGAEAADQAQADARRAFGADRDLSGASLPHAELPAHELVPGIPIATLLQRAQLVRSTSEGRRQVAGHAVRLHETRIEDPTHLVTSADIRDRTILLRVGKKQIFRFDIVD